MTTRQLAYRVPFELEREPTASLYRLTNTSAETLRGVTFTLHGPGVMAVSPPRVVRPLHGIEVTITTRSRSSMLVISWFRPSGIEYLWRVAF